MKYRLLLLTLLLIGHSLPGAAQWYEWTDEYGQRHFSDRKPPHNVDYQLREADENDLLSSYTPPKDVLDAAGHVLRDDGSSHGSATRNRRRQRSSRTQAAAQQARCETYLKKMKQTQAKLRRGYTEPQGNRLRRQRRDLSRRYQDECQ